MPLPLKQMHTRYLQQAGWTADLRTHLFSRAGLQRAGRVLEVGSGTGAVLNTLETGGTRFGLDIHLPSLQFSSLENGAVRLAGGDARRLPYPAACFDLVYCHYLLLWVKEAGIALQEMARVARPGGAVLAPAEPDYGGRIDHPEGLARLGAWQQEALQAQGADPEMGRRLAALFSAAGLVDVELGVMGAQWLVGAQDTELEWALLRADLEGRVEAKELNRLQQIDQQARERGERVLYVPTFYAWGRVRE